MTNTPFGESQQQDRSKCRLGAAGPPTLERIHFMDTLTFSLWIHCKMDTFQNYGYFLGVSFCSEAISIYFLCNIYIYIYIIYIQSCGAVSIVAAEHGSGAECVRARVVVFSKHVRAQANFSRPPKLVVHGSHESHAMAGPCNFDYHSV